MKTFLFSAVGILLLSSQALGKIEIGKAPAGVVIDGSDGGKISGDAWDSASMLGKINFLAYVDPDEKDVNAIMEETLAKEKFPKDKYQSIGIINMEATWLPNFAIASAIASKQEKYPEVIYVKDMKKVLVKEWGLKDDAYVVLVFDKQGRVLWESVGPLDQKKSNDLVDMIKARLDD